uniref:Uncharacterized protein n=1 Tax=Candidatus Nitrotoga fabula TaxID=2182327 RepID=A0A2X0QWP6_9PROT|nr:protein of unknown function [Candidatus Nitrotoga fabula]
MAHNQKHKPGQGGKNKPEQDLQFDTLGIVADLRDKEGRNLAQAFLRETKDPEFSALLDIANAKGMRYVVAAGRFNGTGIVGSLCDDTETLNAAIAMANTRMNEIGSRTIGWVVMPGVCADMLKKATQRPASKAR